MTSLKSPIGVDEAFDSFKEFIISAKTTLEQAHSETDTRVKLIDPVLHILGWKESSIKREEREYTDGTYIDYKLTTSRPTFIIEAKKSFIEFKIPSGGTRQYRISGAISKTTNLFNSVKQARGYAVNLGINYCCVTNGNQYIFFRAINTIGISWEEHMVFVFRSLDDILSRFVEFYEMFSYESSCSGIVSDRIHINKLPANIASRFQRICSEVKLEYSNNRDRNELFPYTKELIKEVFQDLDSESAPSDLLENCYVESARESSYERGIGDLLRNHNTDITNGATKIITSKRDAGAFQAKLLTETNETKLSRGIVVLLLGTVGAGKSTFINRFRKVFARDIIDKNYIWIYLSFNSFTEAEDIMSPWIKSQIRNILTEQYSEIDFSSWDVLQIIYKREIEEYKNGVLNPLYKHNKAQYEITLAEKIENIAGDDELNLLKRLVHASNVYRKKIIVVFDNADQHSVGLQNEIFQTAQKYSKFLKCTVFISLREESYWKNKELSGISAFHSTAFQISAPRTEQVLSKRFRYASKLILENELIVASRYMTPRLELSPVQISKIFKLIQSSLLGEDKRFIRFLEYTSPGEVRRSLEFVARFLTSGHTNINRIYNKIDHTENELIGFHEFLQSVMLGDGNYYKEEHSDVINLFAADGTGDQSNLNRLAVISRVMSGVSAYQDRGYVHKDEVISDCETIGINPETTLKILEILIEKRLLATETLIRDIRNSELVRITTAATYYIKELVCEFSYIDNILIDTDIGNEEVCKILSDLTRNIFMTEDRYRRVEIRVSRYIHFIQYLKNEYDNSKFKHIEKNFDASCKEVIIQLHSTAKERNERVLANARKAFGRSIIPK